MNPDDWSEGERNQEAAAAILADLDGGEVASDRAGDNCRQEKKAGFRPIAFGRSLSEIEPRDIAWVWPGKIPRGRLTLICGEGEQGKSWLTLDIATRLSNGTPWPDIPGKRIEPGVTVLLNAEDSYEDTVQPRLRDAGANLDTIKTFETVQRHEKSEPEYPNLQIDVGALEDYITELNATLCIIDPVTAYLPGVDTHVDAKVRSVLGPLATMADRTRCALIMIQHTNKGLAAKASHRVTGSLAFSNAARMAWFVAPDPHEDNVRVFAAFKSNIIERPTGLRFQIVRDEHSGCGQFRWLEGVTDIHPDELLAVKGERDLVLRQAMEWLEDYLLPGWQKAIDVQAVAEKAGHSERTLNRAKKALKVVSKKKGFGPDAATWWWMLPDQVREFDAR